MEKAVQRKKESPSANAVGTNGHPYAKTEEPGPKLYSFYKN